MCEIMNDLPKYNSEDLIEKILSENLIYDGNIFSVKELQVLTANNHKSHREIISHNGGACILAVTDDDKIIFEYQFRVAIGKVLLELPAGKLEKGEEAIVCAKRELEEETSYRAEKWTSLGEIFVSPGYDNEKIYLFLAENLRQGEFNLDPDERIMTFALPKSLVKDLLLSNYFEDAKTAMALSMYFLKY